MLPKEIIEEFKNGEGKKNKRIQVDLIYKPSEKGNFGLIRALDMLVSEEDIHNCLLNKKLCQQKK
jgi:hypothetical protein